MNPLANELYVIGDSEDDHSCDVEIHGWTSLSVIGEGASLQRCRLGWTATPAIAVHLAAVQDRP